MDLSGRRYGKLTVVRRVNSPENHPHSPLWECVCDCGKTKFVTSNNLTNGNTNSCGCIKNELMRETMMNRAIYRTDDEKRLNSIWIDMKRRCENANYKDFFNYGGRGISVCCEWHNYDTFKEWALANGYKNGLSIDRVNVNGDYEPGNCRWATAIEQANNKRNTIYIEYHGRRFTISELSREYNLPYRTVFDRIKRGWSIDDVVKTPIQRRSHG